MSKFVVIFLLALALLVFGLVKVDAGLMW